MNTGATLGETKVELVALHEFGLMALHEYPRTFYFGTRAEDQAMIQAQ